MTFLQIISKNEKGATAIEYGLIAALIAVAAIGAMGSLGGSINNTLNTTGGKMDVAIAGNATAG